MTFRLAFLPIAACLLLTGCGDTTRAVSPAHTDSRLAQGALRASPHTRPTYSAGLKRPICDPSIDARANGSRRQPLQPASVQYADENGNPTGDPTPDGWHGSFTSLRVGYELPIGVIVAQAQSLTPVQLIQAEFGQRGYIRRYDLDIAGYTASQTTLSLAYEKPGVPTSQEMPIIAITSKQVSYGGMPAIASTYNAYVTRDSSGTSTVWGEDTPDAPVWVVELVGSSMAGAEGVFGAEAPYRAYYVDGPAVARVMGDWVDKIDKTWRASCMMRQTLTRAGSAAGFALFAATPAGVAAGSPRIAAAGVLADALITSSLVACH